MSTPQKLPFKKRMSRWLMKTSLPYLLAGLIKLIYLTLRVEVVGAPRPASEDGPRLYGFWHGRMFFLPKVYRPRSGHAIRMMISVSRDGEFVARLGRLLGVEAVRGSSRRGGLKALLEMNRLVKQGDDGGFTLDGPVGPAFAAKPGALMTARKVGVPIIPVASGYTDCWCLHKSWDRFLIPKPFSRVVVVFGAPIVVEKGVDANGLEQARVLLQSVLNRMSREADIYARDPEGWGDPTPLMRPWGSSDASQPPDHPPTQIV
ncbi:MAG: lysophospholipid acyltransferase family protein [Magnetococcales bacterium]|nr:lysophospholipid acyltransferase family protein [Magnetococcales bacterium]